MNNRTNSGIKVYMQQMQGDDLEALANIQRYQSWILQRYIPYLKGSVLEVGAGIGSLTMHYAHSVDRAVLIEPDEERVRALRERVAANDLRAVDVVGGTVESWLESFSDRAGRAGNGHRPEPFDAILMINVLEHILDDASTLQRLYELLRPGGALLCFVPACQWLYGSLDALVHHHRRYDRKGLEGLLRKTGFDIHTLEYFDIAGILPWLVAGRVLRQTSFNANAAMTYDRFVVPLMSRIEQRVPPPIGKNLTCIAVRPVLSNARN